MLTRPGGVRVCNQRHEEGGGGATHAEGEFGVIHVLHYMSARRKRVLTENDGLRGRLGQRASSTDDLALAPSQPRSCVR